MVENTRINFSILIAPCCFLEKKTSNFWKLFYQLFFAMAMVSYIVNVWGYQHCNTANTTLDIYLIFENGLKSTQTRCKVCSNLTKCTTTIDFRLTSFFFINLQHLSHCTLVLLFILQKGKCWLKVRHEIFVWIIQWC